MTEEKLARIRREFERLQGREKAAHQAVESLRNKLQLISQCQITVEQEGVPTLSELADIGIRTTTTVGLHYKILGQRRQVEASILGYEAEIKNIEAKKASLMVCPECSGKGSVNESKTYERLQEGAIIPVVSMSECALCKGSGRLSLSH